MPPKPQLCQVDMAKLSASFVELCIMLPVVLVVFCFFVMVIFLLRLQRFSPTSVTWLPRNRVLQQMRPVSNPFVLQLTNPKDSSLSGIDCNISSEVSWICQDLWGVQISSLHHILCGSWEQLKNMILEDILLQDSCICRGAVKSNETCCEKLISFSPPRTISASELGNVTRSVYPLVVFMVREANVETPDSNSVVAMITIVHIKDELLTFGSSIISQYLKLADGQLFVLQPLYGPSRDVSEDTSEDNILCVVCQTNPVSLALLPCRHVCVCHQCLFKLDKCPMCRSEIRFHFVVNDESGTVNAEEEDANEIQTIPPNPLTWRQRLAHYNEQLNEFFGFT